MAKGARKTFLNTAQGIGNSAAQQQATAAAQEGQEYGAMMPEVQAMLSPSGDPAVTAATMGALGSQFGAAKQGIMDTAARTGNAASTNAALDQAALGQGTTAAQTAAQNVASQHESAVNTLAKLFGVSSNQVNQMLSQRNQANKNYGSQAQGMLGSILGDAIKAGGTMGAAAMHPKT